MKSFIKINKPLVCNLLKGQLSAYVTLELTDVTIEQTL